MPFMIIGGTVLGGMLIWGFWKVILAFPVHTVLIIFGIALLGWWMAPTTEVQRLIGINEAQMTQVVGRPTKCSNGGSYVRCEYDAMSVTFTNGRSNHIEFTHPAMDFNNNRAFYERVMTKLKLPYHDPVVSTIDEVVWRIPGVGTVIATSNDNMETDRIVISG